MIARQQGDVDADQDVPTERHRHIRVLPGGRIGRCAVIGTGSVVTSDVPEYGVAAGNPATVVKERARVDYVYRASTFL